MATSAAFARLTAFWISAGSGAAAGPPRAAAPKLPPLSVSDFNAVAGAIADALERSDRIASPAAVSTGGENVGVRPNHGNRLNLRFVERKNIAFVGKQDYRFLGDFKGKMRGVPD